MKFSYQNTTYDTEKFILEDFNSWLNVFNSEVSDITSQVDQNEYFKRIGSPSKSYGWVKGKQEQLKYLKTVKGQIEKLRNEVAHDSPPSKSKISRIFMYIAQERLSIDVFNLIFEEAKYIAEHDIE